MERKKCCANSSSWKSFRWNLKYISSKYITATINELNNIQQNSEANTNICIRGMDNKRKPNNILDRR